MTEHHRTGDLEPADGVAAAAAAADADAGAATLSDDERKKRLYRAVQELTREWRASVRTWGDFEDLVVRGAPVNHRRHLAGVAVAAVLSILAVAIVPGLGLDHIGLALIPPAAYALWWLFLAVTGGEEFERVTIDEQGAIRSVKWGRPIDTRGDFLRVAIPLLIVAGAGAFAGWLIDMILFPPFPTCNLGDPYALPEACFVMPGLFGGSPGGHALSVVETQRLETAIRMLPLIVDLGFLLPAIRCLWCMLTGHWFFGVRPPGRFLKG
jgi:hypothetical protein